MLINSTVTSTAVVIVSNLHAVYGKNEVLHGLSLTINQGEFVGVHGPSGCGKSTLLHVIGGLHHSFSGSLAVAGMDLSLVDQGDILRLRRESIGFVFQDAFLINEFSLRDNVELPLVLQGVNTSERRQIVDNTLSEFGLLDQAKKFPHELSGGQVQRGAVARALVNNPSLVLADEPTGSLDRENGRIVMTSLSRAARDRNATVILVSHDEEALSYCDRTIELLDGVIIE